MMTPESIINTQGLEQLRELLQAPKTVTLVGHVSPDGDAVGSTLALSRLLQKQGHTTKVMYPTPFPQNLSFLTAASEALIGKDQLQACEEWINASELIICMDLNEPKRLEMLEPAITRSKAPKVLIDHHPHPSDFVDLTFSYPSFSSSCHLLFQMIEALGWNEQIDTEIAEAIYTGMMTDTGGFSYNSEDPTIYTAISTLLQHGIKKDEISARINRSYSIDKLKLNAYLMHQKTTFYPEWHTAIVTLSQKEKRLYNYQVGDVDGIVNEALAAKDIQFSIFIHEMIRYTKVSLRSKGDFPCNEFAKKFFNGGGHRNASGAEVFAPLAEVNKMVLQAVRIMHPTTEEDA